MGSGGMGIMGFNLGGGTPAWEVVNELRKQYDVQDVTGGDIKKGEQVAAGVCAGCHAVDGNSIIPTNPILAAQHAAYIEKQLHNFQIKDGSKKAMRENAVMVVFASALSDEDI